MVPRVSVGLPVFNGERHLQRALDSILAQDFEDFELIISDNASTDTTSRTCESYAAQDRRVRYFRNATNIGAAPNHNRVFELATAKYFKWAAHDDECMPRMLSRCVEVLDGAPPSVALVYPELELIGDEGGPIQPGSFGLVSSLDARQRRPHQRLSLVLNRIVFGTPIYGVIRSDILRQTRLLDSFHSSDYVLLAELSMLGEFWEVPDKLIRRRLHAGRSTVAHPTKKALNAWLDPVAGRRWDPLPVKDRLAWEYVRSIWRLPLSRADRALCLMVATAHYGGRLRSAAGASKKRLNEHIGEWLRTAK